MINILILLLYRGIKAIVLTLHTMRIVTNPTFVENHCADAKMSYCRGWKIALGAFPFGTVAGA